MNLGRNPKLFILLIAGALLSVSPEGQVCFANTPRQTVSDSLKNLQKHTDAVVKQVQAFLQASGRWSPMPQGADMQLCNALQAFQQAVNKSVNSNRSQPYNLVQADLQAVQMQAQSVGQLLNQVGAASAVSGTWTQVSADLMSLNSAMSYPAFTASNFYDSENAGVRPGAMYPGVMPGGVIPGGIMPGAVMPGSQIPGTVPGTVVNGVTVPGTVVQGTVVPGATVPGAYPGAFGMIPGTAYPYGYPTNVTVTETTPFAPGYTNSTFSNSNPFAQQSTQGNYQAALSNLETADSQTERLVKQVQSFLQMRASWPPAQGSPQMTLCQNLQSFQQMMRKFRQDMQANVSYPILQAELQQLATTSQSIDQSLTQCGATMDVVGRWNEVRTCMANTYQSFYATGTGHHWFR